MESMMQAEPVGTVTSTELGSLGQLGKLPAVNGHVGPPKIKRRKVSAVRDFPPGCSPAVKSVSIENKELNGFATDEDLLVENKIENVGNATYTSSSAAAVDSDQVNGYSVSKGNISVKIPTKNYPPRRRVSAVRDFPPFCGRNAPSLAKDQSTKMPGPKSQSGDEDKTPVANKQLEKSMETGFRQTRVAIQNGNGHEKNEYATYKVKSEVGHNGNAIMEDVTEDAYTIASGMDMVQSSGNKGLMESELKDNKTQLDAKSTAVNVKGGMDDRPVEEKLGKEVVHDEKTLSRLPSDLTVYHQHMQEDHPTCLEPQPSREVVHGLTAAQNCPWRQKRGTKRNDHAMGMVERKGKKLCSTQRKKGIAAGTSNIEALDSKTKLATGSPLSAVPLSAVPLSAVNPTEKEEGHLVACNKEDLIEDNVESKYTCMASRSHDFHRSPPTFDHNNLSGRSDDSDVTPARREVKETIDLFQAVCRELLQEEEAKSGNSIRRVDLQALKILKEQRKILNTGKKMIGAVPGVEIGDEFQYRVELHILGIHGPIQGGIDYMKQGGRILATSIVASGGYEDDLDRSDLLIYTGSGGNINSGDKEPENQKLERGNLALKNSLDAKNPVRVIRGSKETRASGLSDGRSKAICTYIYDGLYRVEKYWQEPGPHSKLVFKFQLGKIPGQKGVCKKLDR